MEKNLNDSYKISKEEFIKLLTEHNKQAERLDKLSDAGLQIWDSEVIEYGACLFDRLLNVLFTEEGVDWIDWWLYEKAGRPDMKAWDEDKEEIPMETMEDLWRYIKQYRR